MIVNFDRIIAQVLVSLCSELDELEREDFTRLKKVQAKKAEKLKAEEVEKEARMAADDHKLSSASSSTNVLPVIAYCICSTNSEVSKLQTIL